MHIMSGNANHIVGKCMKMEGWDLTVMGTNLFSDFNKWNWVRKLKKLSNISMV